MVRLRGITYRKPDRDIAEEGWFGQVSRQRFEIAAHFENNLIDAGFHLLWPEQRDVGSSVGIGDCFFQENRPHVVGESIEINL